MNAQEVRRGHLLIGGLLALFVFLGCSLSGTPAPTPQPTIGPSPTVFLGYVSPTPRSTRTPFPTRTPLPTPLPTQPPPPTMVPPIRIYDEVMHPDWSLEQSEVEIVEQYNDSKYAGFYAMQIRPNQANQMLRLTLRSTGAKAYPAGAIGTISFQLYAPSGLLPQDIRVGFSGSQNTQFWSAEDGTRTASEATMVTLDQLGITAPVPAQTWVKVTYPLEQFYSSSNYQWLTGMLVANGTNYIQPYIIDDVRFTIASGG